VTDALPGKENFENIPKYIPERNLSSVAIVTSPLAGQEVFVNITDFTHAQERNLLNVSIVTVVSTGRENFTNITK